MLRRILEPEKEGEDDKKILEEVRETLESIKKLKERWKEKMVFMERTVRR